MQPVSAADLAVDYTSTEPDRFAEADTRARRLLDEFGCFAARGLFSDVDLEPIRRDVRRLIGLRWWLAGLGPQPPCGPEAPFDDGLPALTRSRPGDAFVLQEALRLLFSAVQVACHPRLERLSRELMGTQVIGHRAFTDAAELRLPDKQPAVLHWHQDAPQAQDAEESLTYWIPLRDCGEREGSLRLAVGSHRLGVVRVGPAASGPGGTAPLRELEEPAVVDRFPHLQLPLRAGDVLACSGLLLHADERNGSELARWVLQVRHANLENHQGLIAGSVT